MNRTKNPNRPGASVRRINWPGRGFLSFLAVASVCALLVWNINPVSRFDRHFSDVLMSRVNDPISLDVQIVHITPADVEAHGGLPFDRDVMAAALRAIDGAGAQRVLMDFRLLTSVDPSGEAAMALALADLGPERVAVSSSINFDIPAFRGLREQVSVVDTDLMPEPDLWHRSVRTHGANPAQWLASGVLAAAPAEVDLRLDPDSVSAISISEILQPDADLSYLGGAKIILSLDPSIAPSGIFVPAYGEIARSALFAGAVHSLQGGHDARVRTGGYIEAVLALLSLTAGLLAAALLRKPLLVAGCAGVVALLHIALAIGIITQMGVVAWPLLSLSLFATGSFLVLVQRLQLIGLLGMLVRGNVSPEEAWAWRTHGQRPLPAVLFDMNGRIKQMNALAETVLGTQSQNLARLVMPRLGERAERLQVLLDKDDDGSVFELEWPSQEVPLVLFRDISESVSREERLKKRLVTDPLTGLLNRIGFDQQLQLAGARNTGAYAVFYMDMNGFKAVNDTHGHDAGDVLLRIVGDRLRGVLRSHDALARLGGDEFGLLVTEKLSPDDIRLLAKKMEKVVEEPVKIGSLVVHVGIAIGFSAPFFAEEPSAAVVKRADTAMYERKATLKQRDARLRKLGAVA